MHQYETVSQKDAAEGKGLSRRGRPAERYAQWFGVVGDLDDFIFYEEQNSQPSER